MLVVSPLIIIIHFLITNGYLMKIQDPQNQDLSKCLQRIIERYLTGSYLNYINLNDDDDDQLLYELHSMKAPVAVVKWPNPSENENEKNYFIIVRNESLFNHANYMIQEQYWDPYVRFIIVVKQLELYNLRKLFDILLGLRVYNVVVVNGTDTAELYSYNAFESNACGNYYTDIISYGKCFQGIKKLYRSQAKSLRNCFLRVTVAHTPPFSMDPAVIKDKYIPGIEQYLMHLLSKAEHFTYDFSYNFNPEDFSKVSSNMTVTGPLKLLQDNNTDVLVGGRFLGKTRAMKFAYIHGYMDYEDHLNTVVRKATTLPAWRDFYRGFSYVVWLSTSASFIIFFSLLILLFKPKDKLHVLMVLFDNLLQHGSLLRPIRHFKLLLIIWVWFSYLLNCFYTSTLVSLINKPDIGFQVRFENELKLYGIRPCYSPLMLGYFADLYINSTTGMANNSLCMSVMDSLNLVGQSDYWYTSVPNFLFAYNDHLLKNKYGYSSVYTFEKSHSNLIYAIFVNKGFPLVEKLMIWGLRFRQTGLYKKHVDDIIFWRQLRYNKYQAREFESRVAVPWLVYAVGVFLSFLAFLFETSLRYYHRVI